MKNLIEEIQKIQNKNERIIKMATSNFEKNMSDLENIVTELEKGDLNLDESISKFEEGIKISKQCNKILEDAEKKITILLEKDGEVKEENFVSEE